MTKRELRRRRRAVASSLAALQEGYGCFSVDERAERIAELADEIFDIERELYPLELSTNASYRLRANIDRRAGD